MNTLGIRIIAFGESAPFGCVNFDNDNDADNFITSLITTEEVGEEIVTTSIPHRELTEAEITAQFGDYPMWAGDQYTTQSGSTLATVVFSRTKPDSVYKEEYKATMKAEKETFIDSGCLVTVTVESVDYTGIFCPKDEGFRSASASSAYRNGVDGTVPPVDFGAYWECEDVEGNEVEIPITEPLMAELGHYVHNWHVSCNNAYIARKNLMLAMTTEQLEAFDPKQDMVDNLPSRSITIE